MDRILAGRTHRSADDRTAWILFHAPPTVASHCPRQIGRLRTFLSLLFGTLPASQGFSGNGLVIHVLDCDLAAQ
jgi:hypothetical protein